MDPEIWGPKAWFFIHNIALTYPRNPNINDKQMYKNFFINLGNVLPCSVCKVHYKENLIESELDIGLNSNIDLFKWTVDIHNKVNKQNNKKIFTYEEALNELNKHYIYGSFFTISNIIILILILIIIVLGYIIYYKMI